ncbi:hypothetical protein [Streptococcus macacae]|nr:hypothetical protein [Streptococcus macacae]
MAKIKTSLISLFTSHCNRKKIKINIVKIRQKKAHFFGSVSLTSA